MTGIVNPFNGPRVDESPNSDDYLNYQYMLHEYLGKGIRAAEAPSAETAEAPTASPTAAPTAATAGDPTDGNPTGGNAQRALQTDDVPDGVPNLTVRKRLLSGIGLWGVQKTSIFCCCWCARTARLVFVGRKEKTSRARAVYVFASP